MHTEAGAGFVHKIDRLIRQEPVRDVAVGKLRRRHQRRVLDSHTVVHLVALLQATQNTDRVLDRRLPNVNLLEATLQGGVLLDVLAVLVERRRTDQTQLTASQQRLNHVAGIHRGITGGAGADDGVQLVDKRNDLAVRLLNLIEHSLQTLLELTAVLRTRNHRAKIQRNQGLALQALRDVARHNAARKPLNDRSLTDARLTDQHRIILRTTGKHLNHTADLRIAADHRVNLALTRTSSQVRRVLLQRLELILRILRGDLLATTNRRERLLERLKRCATLLQQLSRIVLTLRNRGEENIGGNVLVPKFTCKILRNTQRRLQIPINPRVGHALALRARVTTNQLASLARHRLRIHTRGLEHRGSNAAVLLQQRLKHMSRAHIRVPRSRRTHLRLLQSLLRFLCVLRCHITSSFRA